MAYSDPNIAGTRIRLRRSFQAGEVPVAGELRPGEPAINAADGVMYVGKSDGTAAVVAGFPDAPEDGGTYARNDGEWIDIEEAANLQVNRGTAAEVAAYTPLDGEPVWDGENKLLYVGDGQTQGGILVGQQVKVAYQGTAVTIPGIAATYSNGTPLALSPQNSVWQIDYFAAFGGDFTDNASYDVLLGGFSGLSAIDGFLTVIDGDNNVTQQIIDGNTLSFSSGDGLPCVARVDGIIRVTGSSGTVTIGFTPSDTEVSGGVVRSALIARRIA
jgi:hypothetical protein